MPKCVRCNKWGPLLKLKSGLCDECVEEAKKHAAALLVSVRSCTDKINSTTTPVEFFPCYGQLIDELKELSALEMYVPFSEPKPSVILKEVSREEKYSAAIQNLIKRAMCENGFNAILFENQLATYKEKMLPELWEQIQKELEPRREDALRLVHNDYTTMQAMDLCVGRGWCNTAALQRMMKLGYMAAANCITKMEENGWIEPWNGKKGSVRRVLLSESEWKKVRSQYMVKPVRTSMPRAMDGHQFEHYCAELLLKNGFSKAEVTQASGDYGIDVLAEKDDVTYGIQCKYYTDKVGNHAVQEALSGAQYYHCMVAVVMTNSDFTPAAVETARKTNVLLWNGKKVEEMANK